MRRRAQEGVARIEQELAQERALALGRIGEQLEALVAEAHDVCTRLDAPGPRVRSAERAELERRYDELRRSVRTARLTLVIQREAIGLRRHAAVDQQYPELPRRSGARRVE